MYIEKSLIVKEKTIPEVPCVAVRIRKAVPVIDIQEVYRLIIISVSNLVNTKYGDVFNHADAKEMEIGCKTAEEHRHDPAASLQIEEHSGDLNCPQGCTLLHLACQSGSTLMVELLLQFGADVNFCDFRGRTPLHHCISSAKNSLAKFLLRSSSRIPAFYSSIKYLIASGSAGSDIGNWTK
ncbi:hypothetical protein L6164_001045 [Bauhinia variegata]|uniref:Uncharacterized protein n=1 Tax=Bauhinia variegata TaxID=167791 RepID=A0ACB9Q7P9_BAUVA|nr:hypothetical protein L6164_001045 [Bauhinia variegata]